MTIISFLHSMTVTSDTLFWQVKGCRKHVCHTNLINRTLESVFEKQLSSEQAINLLIGLWSRYRENVCFYRNYKIYHMLTVWKPFSIRGQTHENVAISRFRKLFQIFNSIQFPIQCEKKPLVWNLARWLYTPCADYIAGNVCHQHNHFYSMGVVRSSYKMGLFLFVCRSQIKFVLRGVTAGCFDRWLWLRNLRTLVYFVNIKAFLAIIWSFKQQWKLWEVL